MLGHVQRSRLSDAPAAKRLPGLYLEPQQLINNKEYENRSFA